MKATMSFLSMLTISMTAAGMAHAGQRDVILECKAKINQASQADQTKAIEKEKELLEMVRPVLAKIEAKDFEVIAHSKGEQANPKLWKQLVADIFSPADRRWDQFKPRLPSLEISKSQLFPDTLYYYLPVEQDYGVPTIRIMDTRNNEFKKIDYSLSNYEKIFNTDVRFASKEEEVWNSLPEVCQGEFTKPQAQYVRHSRGVTLIKEDSLPKSQTVESKNNGKW